MLIKRIGDRNKRDLVNQSIVMRLAIVSVFNKEGGEQFQKVVDEVFEESSVIAAVTPAQLSKFGLSERK